MWFPSSVLYFNLSRILSDKIMYSSASKAAHLYTIIDIITILNYIFIFIKIFTNTFYLCVSISLI